MESLELSTTWSRWSVILMHQMISCDRDLYTSLFFNDPYYNCDPYVPHELIWSVVILSDIYEPSELCDYYVLSDLWSPLFFGTEFPVDLLLVLT